MNSLCYRLLCVCCLCWSMAVGAGGLPGPVLAALKAAGVPPESVAVTVQAVDGGAPLVSWNAQRAMNPASVMKLLTSYGALELLGPNYNWRTEVWMTGKLEEGVLYGNLYFKGGGDPALTIERFELLLRELRARGLREIRGDLVLDNSLLTVPPGDPGAFDGEALSPYNVLPDALILNFKALRLLLLPNLGTGRVQALPVPDLAGLTVENRITVSNGPCGSWDDGLVAEWLPNEARLNISGKYPLSCGEKTWNLAIFEPGEYFARAFKPLWRELGGSLTGGWKNAPVPSEARLLASSASPPLAQVVRDVNKYSNNLMARLLYLSLGAEALKGRRAASADDGEAVLRRWLQDKGFAMPELVLENGSGLSRRERISAESLNRLLLAAWASPVMPEFVSSLPIVAVDGTMRRRLADSPVAGRAHIKTGSLADAKTIAGYVTSAHGRRYALVFIANGPKAGAVRGAQDALLQWLFAETR